MRDVVFYFLRDDHLLMEVMKKRFALLIESSDGSIRIQNIEDTNNLVSVVKDELVDHYLDQIRFLLGVETWGINQKQIFRISCQPEFLTFSWID